MLKINRDGILGHLDGIPVSIIDGVFVDTALGLHGHYTGALYRSDHIGHGVWIMESNFKLLIKRRGVIP